MKKLIIFALGTLCLMCLYGCKTAKTVTKQTESIIIRDRVVEIRDTVTIPESTATAEALFYCDSLNNVQMRSLTIAENEKLNLQIKFDALSAKLNVQAVKPADTVYVEKIVVVTDTVKVSVTDTKVTIEKKTVPVWLLPVLVIVLLAAGWIVLNRRN